MITSSSFYCDRHLRDLHSFPTRRSSDLSHLPGYDFAVQGMCGIMSVTGEPDGQPMKVGVAWVDILCGLYATIGIQDRKSTRLNSSHVRISYAVFCLKKKTDK